MLKKIFIALGAISLILIFFVASSALAQFGLDISGNRAGYRETNIYSTISTIISIVLSMAGLVFLAIMFWAGLRWMTARGNEEFIAKAKSAMFAAIIGFILVTISYGLSAFIFSRLIK
jgi:uncharacterized membrane protein YwzB